MAVTEPPEQEMEVLNPKWPALSDIDPRGVVLSYDRHSDTLFVHLFGRGRIAVSELVGESWYLLVDPEAEEVVGFQVEDFLARVVKEMPELIFALDVAELRGTTPAEIDRIRRQVVPRSRRIIAAANSRLTAPETQKRNVIRGFLDARRALLGRPVPA